MSRRYAIRSAGFQVACQLAARLASPVQGRRIDAQDVRGLGLFAAAVFKHVVDGLVDVLSKSRFHPGFGPPSLTEEINVHGR